ncbi:hypothetical protein Btru_038475 [Bulinus truncatus]|nr:hypothetical protein Btru_038475 [Bulinus truncatus]
MNLLFLSVTSIILCVIIAFAFKYLSLLRWISGQAYVLSKKKENLSILEVLDLFKNVKPFPISCQKGWKIDSFSHGHRIWFNFLTFPHNLNAPFIKVYAAFDRVKSSSQGFLQVLKDISQSCEWKPGVDCIKEELLLNDSQSRFGLESFDSWYTENVVSTVSVEFKRFWHREDNGVCWLLQMNEALQTCEFYLMQPVQEIDHCLVSIVTWSRKVPDHLDSSPENESFTQPETPLFNKVKNFIFDKNSESTNSSDSSIVRETTSSRDVEKYSAILRYRSKLAQSSLHADTISTASDSSSAGDNQQRMKTSLQRSVSEGAALRHSRQMMDETENSYRE